MQSSFSAWGGGPETFHETHAIKAVDKFDKTFDELKLAKICYSFTSASTAGAIGDCKAGDIQSLKCLFQSNFVGKPA